MSPTLEYIYIIYAWFSILQNVGFAFLSIFLLIKLLGEVKKFARKPGKPALVGNQPGISILVSLKGNSQVVGLGLTNLVHQDYLGPIEMIFITETSQDPAIASVTKLLENQKSNVEVRWIFDEPLMGANPRTAKMLLGLERAKHPYIYWTSPDTVVEKNHLRKMLEITEGNLKKFVTAIPLQGGAKNLWALLENVSFVWGIPSFFLLNRLLGKPQVYGGSLLFHKSLLTEASHIANYLTEEVALTDAFVKNGGSCVVIPQFAAVTQEHQTLKDLYDRNVRWMMIVKYHHRSVYFGCVAYSFFWLLVLWQTTGSIFYGKLIVLYLFSKMFANFLYHLLLKMPFKQTLGALLIPFYEFFVIVFTTHSLFKRTVNWRGDIMVVGPNGVLTRK